jgi:Tn7-like transposition protein D/TniQ
MAISLSRPKHDEPLMSVVSSYVHELDVCSVAGFLQNLFGYAAPPLLYMPSGLDHVEEETKEYWNLTVQEILEGLTSVFYFVAFSDASVSLRVINMMKGDRVDLRNRLGLGFGRFTALRRLRYCPDCFRDDLEKNQRLHWRRVHQLPGVVFCPRHATLLWSSEAAAGGARQVFWPCAEDFFKSGAPLGISKKLGTAQSHVTELASRSAVLLDGHSSSGVESSASNYRTLLKKRGFAFGASQIDLDGLSNAIVHFYGNEYLRWCGLHRTGQGARDWLVPLLCRGQANAPTISHLLLQIFLDTSSEGEPATNSWPICPSKYAAHGPGHRVMDVRPSAGSDATLARCECGMIFHSDVQATEGSQPIILRYGQPYVDEVRLLADTGLSRERIAGLTGLSKESVRRLTSPVQPRDEKISEADTQQLRDAWMSLVNRHPARNALARARKENRRLYRELMLRDRAWMTALRESVTCELSRLSSEDWRQRDEQYLPRLKSAVERIRGELPIRRLSAISILLVAEIPRGVRNRLVLLPKCHTYLNSARESRLDFYKRRIAVALDEAKERGIVNTSCHELLARAGLAKSQLAVVLEKFVRSLLDH